MAERKRNLTQWLRGTAGCAGLALASLGWLRGSEMLAGAATTVPISADAEKTATQSYQSIYGPQEKAALVSKDGADNIALAKTLYADTPKITDNPAMVRVMRDHAAMLLFKSGDSSAYGLAVELEKGALADEKATPLQSMQRLTDMLAAGVRDVPVAERQPVYAQLLDLYQQLAALQVQAHDPDGAVKTLMQVANVAGPANNKEASNAANALAYLLRAMIPKAQQLEKDIESLQKSPNDQKLNTEVVQLLIREWGDAGDVEPYLAKADAAQLKGAAELQKFEAGGRKLEGLTGDQIKELAGYYEAWSKDGRDSKLARLVLTKRAAEMYAAVASNASGGEQTAAQKSADQLNDNAARYEKEAGALLAVAEGGAVSAGGSGGGGSSSASAGGSAKIPQKSASEVQKIIDTEGASDPSWLAGVQMNYPSSLDLTWARPPQGAKWDQSKWLGQFIWSTINENQGQWQNGVKVMYKVMDVNKGDADKLTQTYNALARMYFNYFKDYARAAYWWKKAANTDHVDMAQCYYHLGNTAMAKQILAPYSDDTTRHADYVRAWADIGDFDRAFKMAQRMMQTGAPDVGYLAAGDVCRQYEKFDEALKYYDLCLKQKGKTVSRDYPKNSQRAQDGFDTIKYFNLFDLSKVADGTYKGSAIGYRGPVESVVTVKGHKITDLKVNHREDQFYSSIVDIPAQIMAKQSVRGINACSGATMTSNAIVMGAAKAIGDNQK